MPTPTQMECNGNGIAQTDGWKYFVYNSTLCRRRRRPERASLAPPTHDVAERPPPPSPSPPWFWGAQTLSRGTARQSAPPPNASRSSFYLSAGITQQSGMEHIVGRGDLRGGRAVICGGDMVGGCDRHGRREHVCVCVRRPTPYGTSISVANSQTESVHVALLWRPPSILCISYNIIDYIYILSHTE